MGMSNRFPKIGLALGSGGTKGLAHIGVIKSLEKHNIPIDYIAASSVGSIIGAHYARHKDVKKLENLVLSLTRKQGLGLFDFTIKGGILKGIKMEEFISEILDHAQFNDLQIPLSVVTTDFNTAESVIFNSGNLVKAIRASIAVPAIYQPIIYLNKLLADGGLSNPVPISVASEMGADITIAVNLDNVYAENEFKEIPALLRLPMHALTILRHNLAQDAIRDANIVITPRYKQKIGIIGWNYLFNKEKAKQIIREGEIATDKIIPQIEKQIEDYKKRNSPMRKFFSLFINRT
jgi:NTE family protein